MNETQMKKWINMASYQELLEKWRFAKAGDPFFQGAMGGFYAEIMETRKNELTHGAQVHASKAVGWCRC